MKPEHFPEHFEDEDIDGLVERAADQGLPFRRWPRPLVQLWRVESRSRRRRELAFIHAIGLLLCLFCIPVDYVSGPRVFEEGLWLRLGLVTPVYLIAIFAALYGSWKMQRWTAVLTVPSFATVAVYLGMHPPNEQMRDYITAAWLLVTMASVVVPLRPRSLSVMVVLSLAGFWTVRATMPQAGTGAEDVMLGFVTFACLLTLAIPIRTTNLKDKNFLFALRSRFVSERLLAANEQLRELSHRDDLTGLPNRRYFERIFDTAFRASVDSGDDLAVMMIDVDRFKQFNDTYGHLAGDRALKQVAGVLDRHFASAGQAVARYGGEEFVAIVQGTNEDHVLKLANDLRGAVAARGIALTGHERTSVTVSIGVALRKDFSGDRADLTDQADRALYQAKEAGRNLVRLARPGDAPASPTLLKKSA